MILLKLNSYPSTIMLAKIHPQLRNKKVNALVIECTTETPHASLVAEPIIIIDTDNLPSSVN